MGLSPKKIIQLTRDKKTVSESDLESLILGYARGSVPDYQMASWLMAVFLNGLSKKEVVSLTKIMAESGEKIPRESSNDFWVDKHSTGGVGDKTSLILVPLVVATANRLLGPGKVKIPMVSGRGLGHTGGTIDKLESVPGFSANLPLSDAVTQLKRNSFVMMSQTPQLAPADRKIYALRDATETVESQPLIISSILSKKLSESLDGLVIDLKWGCGAFMEEPERALELARGLVGVAKQAGLNAVAVLTNMNEPLGRTVGHRLEVWECWEAISGGNFDVGLKEVSLQLAGQMLQMASQSTLTVSQGIKACEEELGSEEIKSLFRTMFEDQGGSFDSFEKEYRSLGDRMNEYRFTATSSGYVGEMNARAFGEIVAQLGGARMKLEQPIHFDVGVQLEKKVGDRVEEGETLGRVFHENSSEIEIKEMLEEAVQISPTSVGSTTWVGEIISG